MLLYEDIPETSLYYHGSRVFQHDLCVYLYNLAKLTAFFIYPCLALLLLCMCRVALSRVRFWRVFRLLPLHEHIHVHIYCGYALGGLSFAHVYAHVHLCVILNIFAPYRTHVLFLLLLAVVFGSSSRHTKRFEVFYYTHYLGIPFLLLFLDHANTIRLLCSVVPACILYSADRLFRFYKSFYPSQLLCAKYAARGVLELTVERQGNMPAYRPGDYVYLCVPGVSKTQWHPFSISSLPTRGVDTFTVHVRIRGDWTMRLNALVRPYLPYQTGSHTPAHLRRADHVHSLGARDVESDTPRPNLLVYVDGPLSAPSSVMSCKCSVIAVAQGIGITPFLSMWNVIRNGRASTAAVHQFETEVCRLDILWIVDTTDLLELVAERYWGSDELFDFARALTEGRFPGMKAWGDVKGFGAVGHCVQHVRVGDSEGRLYVLLADPNDPRPIQYESWLRHVKTKGAEVFVCASGKVSRNVHRACQGLRLPCVSEFY